MIVRPDCPDRLAVKDLVNVALFLQLGHFLCIYLGLSLGGLGALRCLAVGLAGAAWVIFVHGDFSDGALLNAVLGIVAVISLSLGQVYYKRQQPRCQPLLVYVIQYAFASVVSLPIAW